MNEDKDNPLDINAVHGTPQIHTPNAASQQTLHSTANQSQTILSASQMGYTQPQSKIHNINIKRLALRLLIILSLLLLVLFVLIQKNIIAFSEFKRVNYISTNADSYSFDFYAKHTSSKLKSGNTQLISKQSKEGRLPLTLSIVSVEDISSYSKLQNCNGYKKVSDVHNTYLDQVISICNFAKSSSEPHAVYIAGFTDNDRVHVITVSQDTRSLSLSDLKDPNNSLSKFGIEIYLDDIERIITSLELNNPNT